MEGQETVCRGCVYESAALRHAVVKPGISKRGPQRSDDGPVGDTDVKRRRDRDKCSQSSRQPVAGTSLADGRMGLECESENHTAL